MRLDTLFDLASLTKVLAVWSVIGSLWESGAFDLNVPLGKFWSEVAGHSLEIVTVRQLLTHTAGLPLRAGLQARYGRDPMRIREGVLREQLHRCPGEAVEYTDRAALILGYLVEYLTGEPLDMAVANLIWQPLGMDSIRFGPLSDEDIARCAPTEFDTDANAYLQGVAHDFSARLLGGVCGISGTFSELQDITVFLRYLLTSDTWQVRGLGAVEPFGKQWITESLAIHTGQLTPARGLFWHPASSDNFDPEVWVHHGFTGTSMGISVKSDTWAVLLTNKLFFSREREAMTAVRNSFYKTIFID